MIYVISVIITPKHIMLHLHPISVSDPFLAIFTNCLYITCLGSNRMTGRKLAIKKQNRSYICVLIIVTNTSQCFNQSVFQHNLYNYHPK